MAEILGGRGLCNGETGIEKELNKQVQEKAPPASEPEQENGSAQSTSVPEDAFEKEMMGLTGGFPGGERGLKKFIQENPPPTKQSSTAKITDLTPQEAESTRIAALVAGDDCNSEERK